MWENQLTAAISKGIDMHNLLDNNDDPTVLTAYNPSDFAILQIQRATSVISLIRQSLAELIQFQGSKTAEDQAWYTRTIGATTFILESVEDELSAVCIVFLPSDDLFKMTIRTMVKASKKATQKIKPHLAGCGFELDQTPELASFRQQLRG